jgi:hypothetical protein
MYDKIPIVKREQALGKLLKLWKTRWERVILLYFEIRLNDEHTEWDHGTSR